MIIGDGIMLGAGGETASIIVTAPTGSTVTCTTPGGIVLTTTEVSGTWKFAKLKVYGTYTVTATNETKIATQDVMVDSATQYAIELNYKLWLYRDGDECEDVTGGFYSNTSWWDTTNRGTATKNADNSITIACPDNYYFICYTTRNKIDVSNFSTVNLNVLSASWFGNGYRRMCLVSNSSDASTAVVCMNFDATGINTIDASGITGSYYLALYGNSQSMGACSMTFDKIWLE